MVFGTVEYLSGDKLFNQKDIYTFYRGKISALSSSIDCWGWIYGIYGVIPFVIPIIPQTTVYNTTLSLHILTFVILLIVMLVLMPRFMGNKIHYSVWKTMFILLIFTPIISLEYDRYVLEDFQDRDELITFLHSDNTDSMVYTSDFVCEDFSRTLIRRARDSGYRMYFYVMDIKNPKTLRLLEDPDYVKHAICKAYIISENKWIEVEPQTDVLEW